MMAHSRADIRAQCPADGGWPALKCVGEKAAETSPVIIGQSLTLMKWRGKS